jgi:uncharacterized protein YbbC (DUF1343 family)
LYPNEFKWKEPPYEYVFDRNPFDVISGTFQTRQFIEKGIDINDIKSSWRQDVKRFRQLRENYLMY